MPYIFLVGGCPSLSSGPPEPAAVVAVVKSNSCDPNPSITLSWTPSITATAEATAELLMPAAPSMGMSEPRPPDPPPEEEEEGLVAEVVVLLLEAPIRPPPLP